MRTWLIFLGFLVLLPGIFLAYLVSVYASVGAVINGPQAFLPLVAGIVLVVIGFGTSRKVLNQQS